MVRGGQIADASRDAVSEYAAHGEYKVGDATGMGIATREVEYDTRSS